jgi:replicative DNA helicase
MNSIRSGQGIEWDNLSSAIGRLHRSPLHIVDTPAMTIAQMRSTARRLARQHGLSLIVVDYIQLARGDSTSTKNGSREQEVSSVSRGLKALAREFNVPVIALSQLNRKVDERSDKRPLMSDLRDSGAIEQDADVILMMYRDDYYHRESLEKGIAEIIIGKQRMGETGIVKALFQGEYSRFRNLSQEAKAHLAEVQQTARQATSTRRTRGFDE